MKAYIFSAIAVSILASIIILLTPDGKSGGLSKHVRLLTSLCVLAVISDPLIAFSKKLISCEFENAASALTEGAPSSDAESIFTQTVSEFSASQLESEIRALIGSEFDVDASRIDVSIRYTASDVGVSFDSVSVKLSGVAIFIDPRSVEGYVTALTGLPCECGIN